MYKDLPAIGVVGHISCRRTGRKSDDGSWPIVAERVVSEQRAGHPGQVETWIAGYAYPNEFHGVPDARRHGWHVRDADGNLLVSGAEGTRTGNNLDDCLYALAKRLMQAATT